jgi:glycosyltransferase involved in cell wall biosynthesis
MATGMRVFYLEPFLRRPESHFVEFALAMNEYLSECPKIDTVLIGHRTLEQRVIELFPGVRKGISQTCFEDLDNEGQSFLQDLLVLHEEFSFRSNDLLVIPTAYENQIIACARFSTKLGVRCPMIAMQFHQLFPPATDSDIMYSLSFRRYWMARLRRAFAIPRRPAISYWTTESKELNKTFCKLSGTTVGILPVPFARLLRGAMPRIQPVNRDKIKVGFIGESRQEKGVLHFLRASRLLLSASNEYHFVLQLNNPRGFSSDQHLELQYQLQLFRDSPLATTIEGGLTPNDHHALIESIDVVVLPYNPVNYWRRISGLLIQAALQCRPVIASDATWAAHAIRHRHAAGATFSYVHGDDSQTSSNLAAAICHIRKGYEQFALDAGRRSHYYRQRCDPQIYVYTILRHYGQA